METYAQSRARAALSPRKTRASASREAGDACGAARRLVTRSYTGFQDSIKLFVVSYYLGSAVSHVCSSHFHVVYDFTRSFIKVSCCTSQSTDSALQCNLDGAVHMAVLLDLVGWRACMSWSCSSGAMRRLDVSGLPGVALLLQQQWSGRAG